MPYRQSACDMKALGVEELSGYTMVPVNNSSNMMFGALAPREGHETQTSRGELSHRPVTEVFGG